MSCYTNLNEEQFDKLLKYQPEKKEQIPYDMFVFSYYTGSLRFFDVFDLQWEHYSGQEERLTKIIHKSKHKHQLVLPFILLAILLLLSGGNISG